MSLKPTFRADGHDEDYRVHHHPDRHSDPHGGGKRVGVGRDGVTVVVLTLHGECDVRTLDETEGRVQGEPGPTES